MYIGDEMMQRPSQAQRNQTLEEMEAQLGARLKAYRVNIRRLDQVTVAERSSISVRALRNLETGNGSSLRTLLSVLRTLGRESWLETIAPVTTINPLMLTRQAEPRQRASKPRSKKQG